jgi:hypothetical protein
VWLPAAARGRIIAINTDAQVEEEEEEVVVVQTLEEVPDLRHALVKAELAWAGRHLALQRAAHLAGARAAAVAD